jgi:N-methylhydantoinase A
VTWRVGVDTGGTFTDVVAYHRGRGEWRERKVWSERGDPGKSLHMALAALDIPLSEVESVVYGTTVVTNALIEGAIAKVALVSTKGFGDVLEIARQRRDVVFGLRPLHRAPAIVPREMCFELDERCDVDGNLVRKVSPAAATELFAGMGDGCEVVAVSFLHSYLNSGNEEEVARIARGKWKHVSVSHEVSPEAREYERTLVTALNASLLPKMEGLVASLRKSNIPEERLHLFHSAGGMVSAETASRFPLLLAMSGPAAGVEAASAVAGSLRLPYAITFDMGGTTTDCSLIVNGRAELQMDGTIGQYAVRQPMVAVESIGAGGGSVVRLPDGGLRIGPDSAGATPGPACYNRGGELPTITDAVAILGYFGSGKASERPISIDRNAAVRAYSDIAGHLDLSPEDVALGVVRVANAVASRAIKRISMGRGIDARSCSLIAFGGAGPMLACLLAGEMGIRKVVIPFRSSALSALGCLSAEPRFTRQRTTNVKRDEFSPSSVEAVLSDLERIVLGELIGGQACDAGTRVEHVALMRYAGQSYEIEIPIARPISKEDLGEAFGRKHQDTYGYAVDEPWECVGFRTTGIGSSAAAEPLQAEAPVRDGSQGGSTRAYFEGTGWCEVTEYRRNEIAAMERIPGPAIIVDEFSTILVPHGWTAKSEHGAHICIENEAG